MPRLTGMNGTGVGQLAFSSDPTRRHALGTIARSSDARKYRYVKAGAVALVVGNAIQSRIEDVDHDDIAVRATAAGALSILITTGSGSGNLDAQEYADGYVVVDTTPGLGYFYKVGSHAAIAASTDGELVLGDGETVQVALTTSSKVTLVASPFDGVIQSPVTTDSGYCVGGCIYPIAAAEFGWIQSGGPGGGLIAGTPAVGQPVTNQGATAGALTVHSAELPSVATMMVTGRSGKVLPVFWMVD